MSDTNACGHSQLVGQREFCPDCGLSRNEVLLLECAPFLKDDETPAECIRRNRKDVDGCLTMLIAERRKNDALRAERDEAVRLCAVHKEDAMREIAEANAQAAKLDEARTSLQEALALLRSVPIDIADASAEDWATACNAFLAKHKEGGE